MRQQFTAVTPPSVAAAQPNLSPVSTQHEALDLSAEQLASCFDKAFSRMRVHTAAGLDGMAAPFIKLALVDDGTEGEQQHVIRDLLQEWMASMVVRGGMPSAWQPVRIQPIYKKGDPLDPGNYRPIAITNVLYRLYASMLTALTDQWARFHAHIPPEQFGFQRRRSFFRLLSS